MFAGHIGAAMVIGRAERRVNLGILVLAALLLDVVLWFFVLLGWESVVIPANFVATHQPEFVFPYSHGLSGAIAWSVLAGATIYFTGPLLSGMKTRVAAFVALAVFSHWMLDALVHRPEMPLAGERSPKIGLALWDRLPVALVVEAIVVVAGLWLFLSGAGLTRTKRNWLTGVALSLLAFTAMGMTVAPPPPSVTAMAASSLVTIIVICPLMGWLGKRSR